MAQKSTLANLSRRRPTAVRQRKKRVKNKAALLEVMRRFFQARKLPHGGVTGYGAFRSGKWKRKLGTLPAEFPNQPHRFFKGHGWLGYDDLLGLPNLRRRPVNILPFPKARVLARTLKITSVEGWRRYRGTTQRPSDLPSNPHAVYANNGWKGYADFLGYKPRGIYWPEKRYLRRWHKLQAQARRKRS